MSSLRQDIEERFIRYAQIDTTSNEFSKTAPSTEIQFDLLRVLAEELRGLGAEEVVLTDHGLVYGTIPATAGFESAPVVSFWGHVDTSPAYSGTDVKPQIYRNYDGSVIQYSGAPDLTLDPAEFPYLKEKIGEDLITSDGSTLLGADDKAGVAICMGIGRYLLDHPEIGHGKVRLCFTPDEEIGRGVVHVDLDQVGADVGYTLDGSVRGEIIYETFSADMAKVRIEGVAAHPGYAKDVLVNALHLAGLFLEKLPKADTTPETTDGRDGFIHVYNVEGTATAVTLQLILRSFEMEALESYGERVKAIAAEVQAAEPRASVTCEIHKQYRNMRYWLENDMRPVDLARQACEAVGIDVLSNPIRGGTDGSRLTEMGLPTPNIFTGMQNFHGPTEYVTSHDMEKAAEVCLKLIELWGAERSE